MENVDQAFHRLKHAMTTTPTLAMPDFQEPFTIKTDASIEGIGVVLSQQGHEQSNWHLQMIIVHICQRNACHYSSYPNLASLTFGS